MSELGPGARRQQILTTESGERADPPHRKPGERGGHTFVTQLKHLREPELKAGSLRCNECTRLRRVFSPFATLVKQLSRSSARSPPKQSKPTPQTVDPDLSSASSLWPRPISGRFFRQAPRTLGCDVMVVRRRQDRTPSRSCPSGP